MYELPRRTILKSAVAAAATGGLGSLLAAQEWRGTSRRGSKGLITRDVQASIDRGLQYLVQRQTMDGAQRGAFGNDGYRANTAVVGLAGLAFMAAGSSPNRGPYGNNISACLDYLLANTQSGGFVAVPNARTHGPMYGHGFATLFLAEVYGMTQSAELRDTVRAAVKLIVDTQNADGGWRYQPVRSEADISVTVCQMMALRAARNAGIFVPNETVDRCINYVTRSQNADGGFSYMLSGGPSAFPRSAAGVVALYSAGIYEGEVVDRALQYLDDNLPQESTFRGNNHFFYGQYYAAQAFWHVGTQRWERYYRMIREVLQERQTAQGFWTDFVCPEYGTAMACIVLQLPNNYLPIFQK
ncbi:prenyltransferase/squalene oxidase repeat-containing protein [Bremerella sp. T1]|uniref:prenyltransferase/squalene oxidase repeat-containing protein n=1 Tax=Bremerella sp. TYQ1 TaxID=3119568 RepID=UPI001CC970AB|nr:prenyltransferase/squalene oxidase repeat-containing protein [Bremerella volcania]UBM38492.1 terpene cyclase/mutase family protein [Bremerella volcania]